MVTTVLDDPTGYGRVVRGADGAVERVVETKKDGDASPEELEIREVNTGIFAFAAGALQAALPRLSADNAQGELYLPQVLDILRADGQAVAAHTVADQGLVLGVNDRVALAQVRGLAQQAINERHMRAGVSIVDPAATVIDVDVEIGADTTIEPFTTIRGRTRIGVRLRRQALLPRRLHARGRRQRRPVRLPASRRDPAQGREGGDVRRDQELRHRRRREGPAPVLHRRRGRRRGHEPRREHDHRQLRRHEQAPHDDRQEGAKQRARVVRRAGDGRRRGVHGRGLGDHRGRARRARSASPARARRNKEGYAQRREDEAKRQAKRAGSTRRRGAASERRGDEALNSERR